MKTLTISFFLILSSFQLLCMDGEIWFHIDDNTNATYYVKALRISINDLLFGANFMEVNTLEYNDVISYNDVTNSEPVDIYEHIRGFNYL
ncbi:MAG: hypothetical protein IH620_03380 [Ignavibacterium sp.]|nr:hypothetical protein [Ignavibacterium sp.]